MKTKRQDAVAESDKKHCQKAVAQLIDLYFPLCENAALVLEPGGSLPPVVVPIEGKIPGCIDCSSWMLFSDNYIAGS